MTALETITLSILLQMWASIEMQSDNRDWFTLITVVILRITGIIFAIIAIKIGLKL